MYPSIPRTAIPLWSPKSLLSPSPLLATGTASGALDASFSNDSILEIWDPFRQDAQLDVAGTELAPLASLNVGSRFNRLAWGYVGGKDRPKGVIAAGLENGEIGLWDPEVLLSRVEGAEPLIARYDLHKGPVRGLDFNPHQTNLLASGATNGEIYIWDLTTPNKPFSPGTRSRSIDDITALAWNSHVAHVLATGSNSGYTVVWDLKSKREVTALSYTASVAQGVGNGFGQPGWGGGGKKGVSTVQWHPNNPTKLATASDDDQHPVIMLWDLRNWKEPEKILTGHEKGILSLSWCSEDSDLLLSTGKDGRTLCWNPASGDIVAEVAPSSNWSFDVQWCPRNPSLFSTASLDGKVAIHSVQQTTAASTAVDAVSAQSAASSLDGAGIFEQAISANAINYPTKSLTQTPKWLKRPASATFGFGGKLVTVANHSSAAGDSRTPVVKVFKVVGEPEVVQRALKLETAMTEGKLVDFCEAKSKTLTSGQEKDEGASWKLLASLFGKAESRSELVEMLGYSKDDIRAKVDEAIKYLAKTKVASPIAASVAARMKKTLSGVSGSSEDDDSTSIAREPLVTFADTPTDGLSASSEGEGAAANLGVNVFDVDTSTASETSDATTKLASSSEAEESEVTEPSLFGDDNPAHNNGPFSLHAPLGLTAPSSQQQAAAADFYSQIGSGRPAALPDHVFGRDNAANSSVAATIGSSSSVASVALKSSLFKIFPAGEADVDKLITQALVLGDFDSAVELSLSIERYADAILLALRGGPELLAKTQKAYFERQVSSLPYLRVFQSVLTHDLSDVVQNADLADWREIFVVLCTFAKGDEFLSLSQVLGQRLERQYAVAKRSPVPEGAAEFRKNAVMCYLAAGNLEKVVAVWIEQMEEEEEETRRKDGKTGGAQLATSKYEAHAKALQTFVEKVTIFQHAVGYVDDDLVEKPSEPSSAIDAVISGRKPYKLAALYERYVEYAELLAAQGLVTVALRYIAQTPVDFQGLASTDSSSLAVAYSRDRLTKATGGAGSSGVFSKASAIASSVAPVASTSTYSAPAANKATTPYQYPTQSAYEQRSYDNQQQTYGQSTGYAQPAQSGGYSATQRSNLDDPYGAYAPPATQSAYQPPQQSYQPQQVAAPYSNSYSQPPAFPNTGAGPYDAQPSFVPAPPAIRESSPNFVNRSAAPVAPPPRSKPDVQWNDAPVIARKATPAAALVTPKLPEPITSPFPNSMLSSPQSFAGPGGNAYGAPPPRGGGQVPPPPPPNRTGARTPGQTGPPPPPQNRGFGQQHGNVIPPVPTMSPPVPSAYQTQPPRFAPPPPMPPPGQGGPPRPPQQQQQQGGPRPFSPAVAGGPGGNFRGAPTPPPSNAYNARPPPPQSQGSYGPAPGQQQQRPGPPAGYAGPAPQSFGPPPPLPNAASSYAPQQQPRPNFNNSPPAQPPAPAPAPPKVEAPKSKYPPGDRSHVPDSQKPIVACLTREIQRLRQITPPQQSKMIQDIERKINVGLFDHLNCGTLSEAAVSQILEICKAIDAKNQAAALNWHIEMLTTQASDVSSFQAALKVIIQRMATQ